jgi:hypothetical protein
MYLEEEKRKWKELEARFTAFYRGFSIGNIAYENACNGKTNQMTVRRLEKKPE